MENTNKEFPGQGKTKQQYENSAKFAGYGIIGMIILLIIMTILGGCAVTTHPVDSCCQKDIVGVYDAGNDLYYHNDLVYYGYYSGYYYYYGKPHYYPWYYYYNVRPPFHYNLTTHIIVNALVNKPVYKPISKPNKPIITHKPNRNIKVNKRTNINRNKTVIINNGSKRTNKTTIRKRK